MPVNEFEKQVQRKMDELQLRPSGEVWEEVEKHIRKDKKRRRVIFWFFIIGAMLAGGSTWLLTSGHKQPLAGNDPAQQITTEKTTTDVNTNNDIAPVQENTTTLPANTNTTDKPGTTVTAAKPAGNLPTDDQKFPGVKTVRITSPAHKPVIMKADPTQDKQDVVKSTNQQVNNNDQNDLSIQVLNPSKAIQNKQAGDTASVTVTGKENDQDKQLVIKDPILTDPPVVKAVTDEKISDDKKIAGVVKDSVQLKEPLATVNPTNTKAGKKKNNKWELGATFFAGQSQVRDNITLFDIFGSEKSLDAAPSNGGVGTGSPQGNFGGPVTPPSPPEPSGGFAWQAGFYAKRKLSSRIGVSAGLDFSALSTTQRTGVLLYNSAVIRNDLYLSSVSNYYSNGTVGAHTNRYYYLQVPVYFHWQVNKGKKLPILWKNGLSFGGLVASDAIIYSAASNVFYRDKNLLNKTQLSYQSGVYVKLFNRTANPLTVGALVNYHISNLEKVDTERRNHLASFGLQLGWIFKK
jgi:hypothetical protein